MEPTAEDGVERGMALVTRSGGLLWMELVVCCTTDAEVVLPGTEFHNSSLHPMCNLLTLCSGMGEWAVWFGADSIEFAHGVLVETANAECAVRPETTSLGRGCRSLQTHSYGVYEISVHVYHLWNVGGLRSDNLGRRLRHRHSNSAGECSDVAEVWIDECSAREDRCNVGGRWSSSIDPEEEYCRVEANTASISASANWAKIIPFCLSTPLPPLTIIRRVLLFIQIDLSIPLLDNSSLSARHALLVAVFVGIDHNPGHLGAFESLPELFLSPFESDDNSGSSPGCSPSDHFHSIRVLSNLVVSE
ncbi:hypothetical protein WR25_08833 [Diploscapter pachys]|uniref:Uncharacterized protein n=1 Tax=Diploscapter pachys TaxID=2018661 RepID=A0A2A2JB03_9BILA|nr:hypothetical protein WR25_08833 [Diploscapter pachys]